jgi:hypothetical protein
MAWTKSPEALVARFDEMVPEAPGVERRQMFGYPAAFVNGNLFMSLFQDHMVLRLSVADMAAFVERFETRAFDPMGGRPMKQYAVVPQAVADDDALLGEWTGRALAYAGSLPKKAPKPRKKPPARKAKGKGR